MLTTDATVGALLVQVPPVGVVVRVFVPELHIDVVPDIAVGDATTVKVMFAETSAVVLPQLAVPFVHFATTVCVPTARPAIVAAGMVPVWLYTPAAVNVLPAKEVALPSR